MPPKRVGKAKLHQLAVELPVRTVISDLSTKKQYRLGRQFATGGFGRIYTCHEVGSQRELVVKVEPYGNGPLFTELNVFMRILKPDQIAQFMRDRKLKRLGVPEMISGGIHQHGGDKLRFLVIPKYATSLEAIREKRKTFTQVEVWTVARCMMESLEYIHSKNYTHADIKAANILLEKPDDFSTSVLVDFGLARMSSSNEDKPDKKRAIFLWDWVESERLMIEGDILDQYSAQKRTMELTAHNGTAIFTSCDAHRGCHPSYRGDLEILAYNMVYWLSGSLPWEGYESNPERIYQMKEAFLKGLPSSLKELLKNNLESVTPLKEVFSIAQKTGYTSQIDFKKLYKITDDVLRSVSSRSVKRKTPAEVVENKKPASAKRNKIVSDEANQDTDVEEDQAFPAPSSNNWSQRGDICSTPKDSPRRHVRLRAADKPSIRVLEQATSPRISTILSSPGTCSYSSAPQHALHKPSPSVRERARAKRLHSVGIRKSPRLGVIPGLSVQRAPCSPLTADLSLSVEKDLEIDAPVNGQGSSRARLVRVASEVKRSPNKLRKIPGMQNFARGRRSLVIDQITKKYKRIVEKKNRLS